jgi:hypothetical protein
MRMQCSYDVAQTPKYEKRPMRGGFTSPFTRENSACTAIRMNC